MFGKKVKDLRIVNKLTLREFCVEAQLDPSNWSKVEREVSSPPGDIGVLKRIATILKLDGSEKQELFDIAAIERNELPRDIADNEIMVKALPAFFRTARGHNLNPEQLENFVEDILKLHKPDKNQE